MKEEDEDLMLAIRSARSKGATKEYFTERVLAHMKSQFGKDAGTNWKRVKYRQARRQINRLWNHD